LLEFKSYSEIDLDETPIVVLSCGHFFTAESLDGLVGLSEVYKVDMTGSYVSLRDPPAIMAVPFCPDCKRHIRQFATQRYNRVINRAVMDETSTKFLIKGSNELENLQQRVEMAEASLRNNRVDVRLATEDRRSNLWGNERQGKPVERYKECEKLEKLVTTFCRDMGLEQQPSKKLFDAILQAKSQQPLDSRLADMQLDAPQKPILDKRVILSGRLLRLRIQEVILRDQLSHLGLVSSDDDTLTSRTSPARLAKILLKDCLTLIKESTEDGLPRFVVQGSVAFARITASLRSLLQRLQEANTPPPTEAAQAYVSQAKKLLDDAGNVCRGAAFDGVEQLQADVEEMQRLLGREWYEPLTADELAAIKVAMVSGPRGIGAHSGHWYKCSNGHPVSTHPRPILVPLQILKRIPLLTGPLLY